MHKESLFQCKIIVLQVLIYFSNRLEKDKA